MRFWVGITDYDWYRHVAGGDFDEVNFWQPSSGRRPVALEAGAPFLFKLHAAHGGRIVGGAYFAHYSAFPVRMAWEAFEEKNGATSLAELVDRVARYRRSRVDADTHQIGCCVLVQPFFFREPDWIATPPEWAKNIVQGRSYDTTTTAGRTLWQQVENGMVDSEAKVAGTALAGIAEEARRYGDPVAIRPRLGQGAFRLVVTDAYDRRCAVTGERTLPVLEAAHIKPYALNGSHEVGNGLLLRSDLHVLFDRGYVTVEASGRVRISRRIKEEFENGRDYYALEGLQLRAPARGFAPPRADLLEWHGDVVFRG